jgi:phenylacetate-CoA ligase
VTRDGFMDEISLQVECPPNIKPRISEELHIALNLRIPIDEGELGTLLQFELKARRVEDRKNKASFFSISIVKSLKL